jgi:hypothetical protein
MRLTAESPTKLRKRIDHFAKGVDPAAFRRPEQRARPKQLAAISVRAVNGAAAPPGHRGGGNGGAPPRRGHRCQRRRSRHVPRPAPFRIRGPQQSAERHPQCAHPLLLLAGLPRSWDKF